MEGAVGAGQARAGARQVNLTPLLAPGSVAIVGASPKPGSFGNDVVNVLRDGGFRGTVYPVNPNYPEVDGLPAYPSVAALPSPPDLAVLAVAGSRLEAVLDDAIAGGARAAAIFDGCHLDEDASPSLLDRLRRKAQRAGLAVCGGNGMGFYNFDRATHVSFQHPPQRPAGRIALIAHSGSVFVLLAANDPRYRFNLIVSPGQEIGGTVADYMDYALDQPSTSVIALFIETVRDPQGFVSALRKARDRAVPVVVTKVGRSDISARLAATHSGAIAGRDAAYEAVFDRYGVLRADDLDELMATALLLSQRRTVAAGGLALVTDSGGLRELAIDLAEAEGVPFARIGTRTAAELERRLPPSLPAVNPLDAAGALRPDYAAVFDGCLKALMADHDTAVGAFEFEVRDDFAYMPGLIDIAVSASGHTGKPFLVVNSFSGAQNAATAVRLLDAGVPMVNGVRNALRAVRHALAYRDFATRRTVDPVAACDPALVERWSHRLRQPAPLGPAEALALLADFDLPVVATKTADRLEDALAAAAALGFPVAVKTADASIAHKVEVDGVRLGLCGEEAVAAAYRDLASRLGPVVTVQAMAPAGVELAFGMVADEQFGPLLMIGAGGRWVELLSDRCFALPPLDLSDCRRLIDRLRIRPVLDGARGLPAADVAALASALARFSRMVAALGDCLQEVDANPIVAAAGGSFCVDALVVGRPPRR